MELNQKATQMENQDFNERLRYQRAKKRVRALSGFYKHLAAYVLVNLFLLIAAYLQRGSGHAFWTFSTFSTAFFWGIGLAFHAVAVFSHDVIFGRDWEARKIRELIGRNTRDKWE